MTTHVTKTWIQDGKLITEIFEEKEIYKRGWVGLTDEEIMSISIDHYNPNQRPEISFAQAIEAALRSKNENSN